MRVRPIRFPTLVDELAERIVDRPGRTRVLIDGAPPTTPVALADALVEALRLRGRPALRVAARDFLRPASLRLEHGHTNPDELLESWLDENALRREVLTPAAPSGNGQVLPRLWNPDSDRAYRDKHVPLAHNGVVLVAGSLLLGRNLPADLTVHFKMSQAALTRHLAPSLHWQLPAYHRYATEHHPESADVLVLSDNPAHPALVVDPH